MPLVMIRADLTRLAADAVVSTTNTTLLSGVGGLSGAIFAAADGIKLAEACVRTGGCQLGSAVITDSFGLPAKKIIHTACPIWIDGRHDEERLLRSCYRSVFQTALQNGIESLAFPLIGGGSHGFAKQLALKAAVEESQDFLLSSDTEMTLYLSLFGRRAFGLSKKLTDNIREYIDDRYIDERPHRRRCLTAVDTGPMEAYAGSAQVLIGRELSFIDTVLKIIDSRGLTDSTVYRKANISKQTFHKLKMHQMNPSKATALDLCLALELPLQDTKDLLAHAGFALAPSSKADLAVECCIRQGVFNVILVQ